MKAPVVILGFGLSGQAAAKLAKALGQKVRIYDEKTSPELEEAKKEFRPGEVCRGGRAEPLANPALIVSSPGIPPGSRLFQAALRTGAPLIGELEFGARHCQAPLLAITGTNGKTTATELAAHILTVLGLKAETAGNIGRPLSQVAVDALRTNSWPDYLVTEVSSFQLEELSNREFTLTPLTAAILNITSDHQNRYADFAEYAAVKFRIFHNLARPEKMILNRTLLNYYQEIFGAAAPLPVLFGGPSEPEANPSFPISLESGQPVVRFKNGQQEIRLISLAETNLAGVHNAENLAAVLALIRAAVNADLWATLLRKGRLREILSGFHPGRHRLELVGESKGVRYVNDSKATNPDATVAALRTLTPRLPEGRPAGFHLLLGGLDKDMDFSLLKDELDRVKQIYLYGQCREKLEKILTGRVKLARFDNFADAVHAAAVNATPGDIVLLAPACASMDMFKNYQDRGDAFRDLIRKYL